MNYEILKEISETFYINMNDIKCGIVEKSPNIYMRFRTAVEELLIQINKKTGNIICTHCILLV